MLAVNIMSQALLAAPSGISPNVQAKINAFFDETGLHDASVTLLDPQTGMPNVGNENDLADSRDGEALPLTTHDNKSDDERVVSEDEPTPQPQKAKGDGERKHVGDKSQRKPRTGTVSSLYPRPKFIARYAYPSESHHLPRSSLMPPRPASAPASTVETRSPPSYLAKAPSLSSMIAQDMYYLLKYITAHFSVLFSFRFPFFSSEPSIIEYLEVDMELKPRVHAKAQESKHVCEKAQEKVIRVIALMTNDEEDKNESRGRREATAKPVEIKARPKRLREILRAERRYVAEDLYRKEIRAALRKLRE